MDVKHDAKMNRKQTRRMQSADKLWNGVFPLLAEGKGKKFSESAGTSQNWTQVARISIYKAAVFAAKANLSKQGKQIT